MHLLIKKAPNYYILVDIFYTHASGLQANLILEVFRTF